MLVELPVIPVRNDRERESLGDAAARINHPSCSPEENRMSRQDALEREVEFHDAIAEGIVIDSAAAHSLAEFDSPASYFANRLPRLKRTLLQAVAEPGGKKVLVYGCGNDNAAVWFAKSGASVDAIDISPKSVQNQITISRILDVRINAMVMDAHKLDLESAEYDIVYGNAILHHLDLQVAIPEVVRVLKPGGKAIFRDVMNGNILLQAFRRATPYWRTPDEQPLRKSDLVLLAKSFATLSESQYVLTAMPYLFAMRIINALVLRKLGIRLRLASSEKAYTAFDRLDTVLFRIAPILKTQAWLCLIVATKT